MMLVMRSVTNPPPMVGHKNGRMCNVAHKVIQLPAVAETLVATVSKYNNHSSGDELIADSMADSPREHSTVVSFPEVVTHQSCPTTNRAQNMVP